MNEIYNDESVLKCMKKPMQIYKVAPQHSSSFEMKSTFLASILWTNIFKKTITHSYLHV